MADAVGVDSTTPSGRTFHVWGPQGYDPNKAYPVVVMFHGWYTDGRSFESWFQMEQYVNNEAFVVYPDAANQLWDLEGTSDLVFFDDLVKTLGETYCIDPSRVFGFGFSYGGKFAHHLGCQRAGYVKAISVGDGSWGLDPLQCGRLPVLVTHRTHDNDELVAWGKTAADNWVTINGCTADTTISDPTMNCTLHPNCRQPGGTTTFCEDTWFDATWPNDWNHTVREPYRTFTWQWFAALP
ncbi:LpqC [Labilithrix luteola]|uniref:LpqC n=2 Tax=Labilithrix luteola TaxID=1391654 RepID=A0A0K1PK59_9BACT|nr:LpqC [Labilithrix luteola]